MPNYYKILLIMVSRNQLSLVFIQENKGPYLLILEKEKNLDFLK
jgi:hypothetical protein